MITELSYHGWRCLQLSTGSVELTIPTEVGPRVIAANLVGQDNLFATMPEQQGGRGEDEWMIRGGHRLWHSPEHPERTYALDNSPIEIEEADDRNGLTFSVPAEKETGIAKSIEIKAIAPKAFCLTHKLTNHGLWPIELAGWALSVMAHGGYGIMPLMPKGEHPRDLLPNSTWIPWSYTDLSLPSWELTPEYIGIDVSKSCTPQKLGLSNYPGWLAYWQEAGTFVKYSPVFAGARYPDFGSACEVFHCDWMIELETLSPLIRLAPGDSIEHVEYWGVLPDVPKPDSLESYREGLLPAVKTWMQLTKA